jgi:hypothetical protein
VVTRRALVVGLAGLLAACAAPSAPPTASPTDLLPTAPPARTPTPPPTPAPTARATLAPATARPTEASPTATPVTRVELDIRVWNGAADLQLDGRPIDPGHVLAEAGTHEVTALVEGQVVAAVVSPATGSEVNLVLPPQRAALAVMIENQADARPQTGLTSADVVYEALAEGGITRFIALFLNDDAPVVGPVRSLRHYFAFFAAEYGADVVHIGASPEGYAWRDALNMGHLDETFGEPGIWRVGWRPPPHNAYTDTTADREILAARGRQVNRGWGPLLFSEQAARGTIAARQIGMRFRPWAYRVEYAWDEAAGRYLRSMEGQPHRDGATGDQVAPAAVVVQFADVEAIPDDPKLRLDVDLAGAGGALVAFSSGTRRDGSWTKPAADAPSTWLDEDGNPMVLPPGPVWVEVLPIGSALDVTGG